ncbi:MAG: hypothetical protein ACYDG2_03840 [Ruminiclostridium sp.]
MVTTIFVVWTAAEGISLSKSKMWYKSVRDKDERTEAHSQRAGYITFWINMIGTAFMFIFYSFIDMNKINPLNFAGVVFVINIISFIALKAYFIQKK